MSPLPRRPLRLAAGPAALLLVPLLLTTGCRDADSESSTEVAATATPAFAPRHLAAETLGDPIPGLTPGELAAFQRGKALFEKRFTPAEGLGPLYNAVSCSSCHSTPTAGGSSELYRNFYLAVYGTAPIQFAFPDLPSSVVPAYGPHEIGGSSAFDLEAGRFSIPSDYFGQPVTVGQRNAIPIFGTGLFEFISNTTILANADPFDADGDGISGRGNYDFGDLGRFGAKAQANNIERFTRPPLVNQMGITTDPFLGSAGSISLSSAAAQVTGDPDISTLDNDSVPDPEMSTADLGDLISFSRFLAPPARLPFDEKAQEGEQVFAAVGCTKCHVPSLDSSRGPVEAYTDLLIHDMGPALADGLQFGFPSPGGISTAAEFRTQPLWGVSLHPPFLHDGRAETLFEAIDAHGGEAQQSRDAFIALPTGEQRAVISFLEHL